MAPEVIACEISRDTPYDYKVSALLAAPPEMIGGPFATIFPPLPSPQQSDMWSAGITCIELAEMHPPHHEMNPMRVLVRIPRSDPPTLQDRHKWSDDFHSFLAKCLVKQPAQRPTAKELLEVGDTRRVAHKVVGAMP